MSTDHLSERFKNKVQRNRDEQRDSSLTNPCYEEAQMTIRCLNRSQPEDCSRYSLNFKKCKKFWSQVVSDRKVKGIEPALPAVEDRPQVMDEYHHWLFQ